MKPIAEEKWAVDEDYEDDKQRVIAICGEQGYICGIHIDKEDNPRLQFSQEDRDRARLIAAAPAMRDTLKEVDGYLTALSAMQPGRKRGTEWTRIRALIQSTLSLANEERHISTPCYHCGREENGKWFVPCPSDDCPSHEEAQS